MTTRSEPVLGSAGHSCGVSARACGSVRNLRSNGSGSGCASACGDGDRGGGDRGSGDRGGGAESVPQLVRPPR